MGSVLHLRGLSVQLLGSDMYCNFVQLGQHTWTN